MKRDLPFTREGDPKISRTLYRFVTGGVAMLVSAALVVGPAYADDLDDERDRVNQQLAETERAMGQSDKQLGDAAAALQQAEVELSSAQAELARTQEQLAAAQVHDAAMAEKLAAAEEALRKAEEAVAEGQRNLAAEQQVVGDVARHSYQSRSDLIPIALWVQDDSMSDMQTRAQWSNTMQQATEADMGRLREIQEKLDRDKAEKDRIEKEVAVDRQAAADALAASEELERQAAAQEAVVTQKVNERAAAKSAAEEQVAQDQAQYEALTAERAAVDKRIAERIAREKAEAERKAAAEKRAREAAARERAAKAREAQAREDARKAKASKSSSKLSASRSKAAPRPKSASRSASRSSAPKASSSSGGALLRPTSGPLTSQFGMRLHPVLKYRKLHDGTDYGAACGAPIYAVASGKVTERYFNAGYGNRLMVDHGKVNGDYLTTSYNHLSKYAVSPGQRVKKGQVIGYVGTTGYSTGCHLHFMTWTDGKLVNPMSLY